MRKVQHQLGPRSRLSPARPLVVVFAASSMIFLSSYEGSLGRFIDIFLARNTTQVAFVWQFVCILSIYLISWLLTRKTVVAASLILGVAVVLSTANVLKIRELGLPLELVDLGTPPPVALLWPYLVANLGTFGFFTALAVAIGMATCCFPARVDSCWRGRHLMRVKVATALSVLCVAILTVPPGSRLLHEELAKRRVISPWRPHQTAQILGPILSLSNSRAAAVMAAPAEYDPRTIMPKIGARPARGASDAQKDVVFIMLESFVDPSTLGVTFSRDPIANMRRLSGGALEQVVSPSLGGLTANVEFEVLTGIPIRSLPPAMVPYAYGIDGDVDSLVRVFNAAGYDTYGMHNFLGKSWNRQRIYPLLGFGETRFLPPAPLNGGWPEDQLLFDWVTDLLARPAPAPRFVFGVTVNTHGPYTIDTPRGDLPVRVVGGDQRILEDAGLRLAIEYYGARIFALDQAIGDFLAKIDLARTHVLLFGDHQPALRLLIDKHLLLATPSGERPVSAETYQTPVLWLREGIRAPLFDAQVPTATHCLGATFAAKVGIPMTGSFAYWSQLCASNPAFARSSPEPISAAFDGELRSMAYYLMRDDRPRRYETFTAH